MMKKIITLICLLALSQALQTITYPFDSTDPTADTATTASGNYQATFPVGTLGTTALAANDKVVINVKAGVHGGAVSGITATLIGDDNSGTTAIAAITFPALVDGTDI